MSKAEPTQPLQDALQIAGRSYASRLLVGTGKYKDLEQNRRAVEASGAEIVTVAVRRVNIGQNPGEPNLLEVLPPDRYTILPNTAGCYTAEDAVRTCRLARELLDDHRLVKLEVLGDAKTLFPDVTATLVAAEQLVKEGFEVMVYTSDDPIIAKRLEQIGCVAVMPLAAPIGLGLGIQNRYDILSIIENARVPNIVDAGVGTASDAAIAMELGCDGVLMNTAIAEAKDPILMASAMKHAIIAGREAFRAGRMPRRRYASASSPARRHHRLGGALDRRRPPRLCTCRNRRPPAAGRADAAHPQLRAPRGPHHAGRRKKRWSGCGRATASNRLARRSIRRRSSGAVRRWWWRSASAAATTCWPARQARPDTDFIGIEVHRPGAGRVLQLADKLGLGNLRVLCADAVEILRERLPAGSVDEVVIFFPDPWPKKRHQKRRLIQPAFVAVLARALRPGGRLRLATDWADYARHMLDVMSAAPLFANASAAGGAMPRPADRPLTRFESRGLRLGHEVADFEFLRVKS